MSSLAKIILAITSLHVSQIRFLFSIWHLNTRGLARFFGGPDGKILSRNPLFVRKIISATAFMEISQIPFSYLESENAQSRQEKSWAAFSSLFGKIISACASLEVSKFHLLFFDMGIGEPSPWKNPGSLWVFVSHISSIFLYSSRPWGVVWIYFIRYRETRFPKKISFACLVSMWGVTPWASGKIISSWSVG